MASNPRTCVGCRRKDSRVNLVRIVRDGSFLRVDEHARMPGRGAWIHSCQACLTKAGRTRAFSRALRVENCDMSLVVEQLGSFEDHGEKKAGRNPMGTK